MADILIDGDFLSASEVGAPRWQYPFRMNGDSTAAYFDQDYWQRETTWAPQQLGIPHPTLSDFFLISETDPERVIGGMLRFTRRWSRIPDPQSEPSSTLVNRPDPDLASYPGALGDYFVVKPVATLLRFDVYLPKAVLADTGFSVAVTGGTYTITFNGSTTSSLNHNASNGVVQSALNGLAGMAAYGSVAVTGTFTTGFTITFADYAAATINATSITGGADAATSATVTAYPGRLTQFLRITRPFTSLATGSADISGITTMAGATLSATVTPIDSSGSAYAEQNVEIILTPDVLAFGTCALASLTHSGSGKTSGWQADAAYVYDTTQRRQRVRIESTGGNITGGTYTLTMFGDTTASIPYNASYADIQTALNALAGVAARGGVLVYAFSTISPAPTAYYGGVIAFGLGFTVPPVITGGTYTITVFGGTTSAIPYNADAVAIGAALNALSGVTDRGGVGITGIGGPAGLTYGPGIIPLEVYGSAIKFTMRFGPPPITGGTYTVTVFGNTTSALAYNASESTVSAAINGLTNVTARGGCVVTLTYPAGAIAITLQFAIPSFTVAGGSLLPSPSVGTVTPDATGRIQTLVLSTQSTNRYLSILSHGLAADGSDYLMFERGSANYFYGAPYAYIDDNTIAVNASLAPFNNATLFTRVGRRTVHNYEPGSAPTRATRVTRFSVAPITPDAYEGDGTSFLLALFSGATEINYSVGDAFRWPDDKSVINAIATVKVAASDIAG